jgi:hypothetical protein
MQLSSVGTPAFFTRSRGLSLVAVFLFGLVPSSAAVANHDWLSFTSDGRWRSSRLQSAPAGGQDPRFELADLNGDGKLDFASNVAGGVQSALGNGDGTFQPLQFFGDGTTPKGSFALGDLNNDGIPDAVTADENSGENTVSVFLGDGSGGFGPRTGFTAGTGRRWLALGDVNRDGKLDLAFASAPSGGPYTVGVVLGNGSGGFVSGSTFAEASPPSEMSLVDLNGDGKLDMLWIQSSPNQVSYRLGNGAGSFGAATRLVTGAAIVDVQTADFNADGRLDLIWTRNGATNDSTSIALGLPGGGFGAPSTIALMGDSETIAIGDFTEDGKLDFVSLLKDGRVVYAGLGDGTFDPLDPVQFPPINPGAGLPINFTLTNVVVTDLNKDGHDDIVYGLPAVDFGNGNGSFGDACAQVTAAGPSAAVFARIDSDALPDLVVACRGTAMMSVLFNAGSGGFLEKRDFPIGAGAAAIASADFDGNGKADIVTANQTANTVSLLRNNSLNAFFPKVDFTVGAKPIALRAADLNADGKMDLVVVNNASSSFSVLMGNGAGSFGPKTDYPVSNPSPTDVVVGDFNNDSKLDVAVAGDFTGFGGILVRLGNGDGTFGAETVLEMNQPKHALAVGDFNKDGKLDIAATDVQFQVTVLRGNGDGTFGSPAVYFTSSNAFSVEAADLDGDGNLDLLLGHSYGYFWTLKGSAGGTFTETGYGFAGRGAAGTAFIGHQIMAVGDWTLSGRVGVAMVGETSNTVTFLRNRGPGIDVAPQAGWLPPQAYATEADPRGLAVADFNRDGRRDAAAAAAGTNAVALHLGEGNGSFESGTGFAACTSIRALASGDLNKDGKPDALSVGQTGMISVLLGDGAGGLGPKSDVDSGGTSHDVAIGDVDGNGTPDAVSDDTGSGSLKAYLGNGNGTFAAALLSALPAGPGCSGADVDLADVNLDGKLDAVVATAGCGQVELMLGNGAGSFTGTALTMGTSPGHVVVGDFNGDGRPDIAASDASSNMVVVRLQNPATPGAFLGAATFTGITAPGDIAAADVDMDGDLDLLVGSTTQGAFAELKNNGNGTFAAPIVFSMNDPVSSIAVDDLNRDGLLDVITAGSDGTANSISVRLGTRTIITGVDSPPVNAGYALEQNRPNPFNPVTKIRFAITRSEPVRLRVYDARGRLVATLLDSSMPAGTHEVSWAGRNQAGSPAASGVYFYKLEAGEYSMSRRMVLLK